MTQAELEHEVAGRTGESVATIRRRGFSIVEPEYPRPLTVNWDAMDAKRMRLLPASRKSARFAA